MLLTVLLVCSCSTALGWGRNGHAAIAYIAECNLTPRAKKTVEKILDDHSIVYYASWLDHVRTSPEYKKTSPWHVSAVDSLGNYTPLAAGDAVACIEQCMESLENYKTLDDSTVLVSVRYLIHLVGDMHCPTHVKYPMYKSFGFYLNGKKMGFHGFWDTECLTMNHPWSYTEYAHQLDRRTKAQKKAISAGAPRDWLRESAADCRVIYDLCIPGKKYSKPETAALLLAVRPLAEEQVLKAGYRLAHILNELFG